jgi:hypothetical protein
MLLALRHEASLHAVVAERRRGVEDAENRLRAALLGFPRADGSSRTDRPVLGGSEDAAGLDGRSQLDAATVREDVVSTSAGTERADSAQ